MTNVQALALDLLEDARIELRLALNATYKPGVTPEDITRCRKASDAVRAAHAQCQLLGAFEAEDAYIPPVLSP